MEKNPVTRYGFICKHIAVSLGCLGAAPARAGERESPSHGAGRRARVWAGAGKIGTVVGALLSLAVSAGAQTTTDPISGPATVLRLQNAYVLLAYGQSGTPTVTCAAAPDTNVAGRWGVATTGGDPTTAIDDGRGVVAWNFLSYQVEPSLTTQATKWYRLGNTADGTYSVGPVLSTTSGTISSTWDTTGTIDVLDQDQPVGVRVQEKISLMRDIVRAEYKFVNSGAYMRTVRARFFMDPIPAGSWIVGRQRIENETDFAGGNVPADFRYYATLKTPEMVVRGIVDKFDATVPSRFVIGQTAPLANGVWDYAVQPSVPIDGTANASACQAYYNGFTLGPNQSRTIVVYAGLGNADCEPTPPYVLAAQAPRSLGFVLGDDTETTPIETSYPSPHQFNIQAFIYNTSDFGITSATLFLNLPKGLSLLPGQTAARTVSSIPRQSEGQASWRVQVDPGASGVLSYTVTSGGVPVTGKAMTGTIEIPAQTTRQFKAGLSMISIPFHFANPDTDVALGMKDMTVPLARWDSTYKRYDYHKEGRIPSLDVGAGYWYRPETDVLVSLVGAAPVADSLTENQRIVLKAGWNMIGSPFVYAVPWGNVQVSDGAGGLLSLAEATNAGWLRPTLFAYNSSSGSYQWGNVTDAILEPWVGYWVRADRSVSLVVPAVATPGASVEQRADVPEGWRIQIAARAKRGADLCNFAGASRAASDGWNVQDVDEPPVPGQGWVSLRFVHSDWGNKSGWYTQDIRGDSMAADKVWDFEVETDQDGEDVTLSWPALTKSLPRDLNAILEDTASGKRVYLRTQGSYAFRATAGVARSFKLTISRRAGRMLSVSGLEMTTLSGRAGARSINFQVSADAVADVRILSPTGRVLKQVASRSPAKVGQNSVVWDGTTAQGVGLTSGLVMLEVTATSPEGASVRAVRPCVLVR